MKDKFYITTPIYYPSGKFHIGNTYTTVLADAIKRYEQMKDKDVFLLTGTDEHGQKIAEKAEELGMTEIKYVDGQSDIAKELWKKLDIKHDDFIRTTEERHKTVAKKIFEYFLERGDIYKGNYEGMYCTPCETFFTKTQLKDGKCPDCGRDVRLEKEESYFFNMKKYIDKLLKYYEENNDFVLPEYRKTEMINNFIKPGLEDLCVTRTTIKWGIQVNSDPKHTMYVWLDALTNYISALGYKSDDETLFNKYWPADLQIVGKDIARFHLIYWPIFLMALDLPLPKTILVHNFVMMKDGKMSKSKGNVIYPEELVKRYGLDALKYGLLRDMPVSQDAVFSPESFIERYNVDLCNDLSNLLNRTVSMVNKYFNGTIEKYLGKVNEVDKEIEEFANEQIENFENKMEKYEIANALGHIFELVSRTNKYIDETTPWVLVKEEKTECLQSAMYHLVENLRKIAILTKPFIPTTSNEILRQLGIVDESLISLKSVKKYDLLDNIKVIEKGEPIFMRLNVEEEVGYLKDLMQNREK